VAHALPVASLKRIFAVILYALAGYMVWRAMQG
ncbi:MAG: sulfite exporter TauE/SafE family protein, partial [Betaproteobacteria bacterium]|nr:sulfite exporter TauE/SafE family protein [Betaproteobacteria bacterium]